MNGEVQAKLGPFLGGVFHNTDVCKYQGIYAVLSRLVDSSFPLRKVSRLWVRIDCDIDLCCMAACISQALLYLLVVEVKPGEVSGIGLIPETDIDRVCPIVDGSLE